MKFDLGWFFEIPGILITVGIVLLIVALVMLLFTSKKSKKEKEGNPEDKKAKKANFSLENRGRKMVEKIFKNF